jgi:hypothetical protein
MRYFRWLFIGEPIDGMGWQPWVVSVQLDLSTERALQVGARLNVNLVHFEAEADFGASVDFPFTIPQIPVVSARLRTLIMSSGPECAEFFPLTMRYPDGTSGPQGYSIANYLTISDCLDRQWSDFDVYTKDNLRGWERQPALIGQFRDVRRIVIDRSKIGDCPVFRLWGWPVAIIVREDLMSAIQASSISGCVFGEVEVRG